MFDWALNTAQMSLPSKHSSWWRRLEDVLKTSFVLVFGRCLQDFLIKRNIFTLVIRLQKTSSRRLGQDHVLAIRFQDVFKMFSRRFQGAFKMSSRCLAKPLHNIFKTSNKDVFKTFSRRIMKFNCSCEHVFKTSLRYIQNISEAYCKDGYLQKDFLGQTSEKFMVSAQNLKEW